MLAEEVYLGSDGKVTTAYYEELAKRGPAGIIALNLFRAHKCSSRAKVYRRRGHKSDAYDRKNWSMQQLCGVLVNHDADLGIRWGWKQDPNTPGFEWVLYVDLPQGQASFHSAVRYEGPDYTGEWCQDHNSQQRILAYCDSVMGEVDTRLTVVSVIETKPVEIEESAITVQDLDVQGELFE